MADQQKEAMLYERREGAQVQCRLCAHECTIAPDKYGLCRVRRNVAGRLFTCNYHALVAMHVDPIEKKPLFHFLPGSTSLSIAAAGCNFQCAFCQNWQISQAPRTGGLPGGQDMPPERIVQAAVERGCASVSYTYTEPTVFFELAYDTARLARQRGIRNCFVSNGYMTPAAVEAIAPYLDAINVDLKAFRDETYQRVMKARLEPVLLCLRELVRHGVWVEVTTLIVPGMNDSTAELRDIAGFIAGELGPDVPWHVSRFHGDYQMQDAPPTPVAKLHEALKLGQQAGLRYVYAGNVGGNVAGGDDGGGDDGENTYCHNCRDVLVRRQGFNVLANRVSDGRCPRCSQPVAGVWS